MNQKKHALKQKARAWLCLTLLVFALAAWGWLAYQKNEGVRFVRQLGAGINLGNSLDVYKLAGRKPDASVEDFETYWGNPPATPRLMAAIRDGGFSTVRIPVSWGEHMDENGDVDPAWMARVTQVVDDALDAGLYVILDTHHEPWLEPTSAREARVEAVLRHLWAQIAENFAGRGEHLLFEGMNEPRLRDSDVEWTSGSNSMRGVVNRLNAAFVETVRAAGGENTDRWLLLPAYATAHRETALSALELPADRRLIVAVHAYLPYSFTLDEEGDTAWSSAQPDDTRKIDELMDRLDRLFLKRKIPVVITEFGCHDRVDAQARLDWAGYYTRAAREKGIPLVWWDNGKDSRLIDRATCQWTQPELARLLVKQAVS